MDNKLKSTYMSCCYRASDAGFTLLGAIFDALASKEGRLSYKLAIWSNEWWKRLKLTTALARLEDDRRLLVSGSL